MIVTEAENVVADELTESYLKQVEVRRLVTGLRYTSIVVLLGSSPLAAIFQHRDPMTILLLYIFD